MQPLVSTVWLAGELGKPDLVVFDATYYMANENRDAALEFRQAHIPGARFFDIDAAADPDTDLPHMVPSPAASRSCSGRWASAITRAWCSMTKGASFPPRAAGG